MEDLEIYKPIQSDGVIKATIHKSGNLGFSSEAINIMKIDEKSFITIAFDPKDIKLDNIYLFVKKEMDENTIKVNKAGKYYYISTRNFFNVKGIDYKNKKIIYDISVYDYRGETIFKLFKREKQRKNSL